MESSLKFSGGPGSSSGAAPRSASVGPTVVSPVPSTGSLASKSKSDHSVTVISGPVETTCVVAAHEGPGLSINGLNSSHGPISPVSPNSLSGGMISYSEIATFPSPLGTRTVTTSSSTNLIHGCVPKVTCDDETVVEVTGTNSVSYKCTSPTTSSPPVGTLGVTSVTH